MDFLAATLAPQQASQAEQELRPLLLDESCQVLSSFELNKTASLTYGDLVCDELFEFLESILSKPLEYSPLTMEKSLAVLKHVMIYGSEKSVNSAYGLGRYIEFLTTFNTVLAAQQQQGAMAFIQRIQGGGVDKAGPLREVALEIQGLLQNINELRRIRNASASRHSLVPVGSNEQVGFVTDEVRLQWLKQKLEQEQKSSLHIKSNLTKAQNGFGAGYTAKDGKNVVGAAHGIEEMIQMAKHAAKSKRGFSDDGPVGPTPEDKILQDLVAQARQEKMMHAAEQAAKQNASVDLLGADHAAPVANTGDLLSFGGTTTSTPAISSDPFSLTQPVPMQAPTPGSYAQDLLSLSTGISSSAGMLQPTQPTSNMLSDPFGSTPMPSTSTSATTPAMNGITTSMGSMAMYPPPTSGTANPMSSNEDRFAALDALSLGPNPTTTIESNQAEQRILGMEGTAQPTASSMTAPLPSNPLHQAFQPSIPNSLAASSSASSFPAPVASVQVAAAYGDSTGDESDNPWVMGGAVGTGLQPLGPAPAGAPPLPPPS